ncbi:MAG: DUF881 domain-containing protein [Actinomyces sp.]|nr:DUF881 domain-containing protein [Actinomyces sp.]MCI1641154.1 DUF881 domain-containing protein [Actinomyces sp.]MCI1691051.1 DUF881 domain-containing protein [Actinomyces sp.]MCI1788690.1 DUF881 domain-containing protein [Actinomyces sp.]MCI1829263.1 DUF881 domain-containing protein [Actinomyces sp.]
MVATPVPRSASAAPGSGTNRQAAPSSPEDPARRGGESPRDPAASMSLLTQLLNNPLDAGYHAYSAEERARRQPLWRRALILLLAIALGAGSAIAVRNLRAPAAGEVGETLLDQARSQLSTVQSLDADVASLSSQVGAAAGASSGTGADIGDAVAVAAAVAPVEGPGLVVTLDDRPDSALDTTGVEGAVTDQDLRVVVNALWSGGAEAITVNGLRIGPGTFVRRAGAVILVDITTVQAPYEVAAIGDANALAVALVRGDAGDHLSAARSVRGITMDTRSESSLEMDALDSPATTTGTGTGADTDSSGD